MKWTQARREAMARIARHGTVFTRDVSRSIAKALADAGLVEPYNGGGGGRLSTLTATEAGREEAAAQGLACTCRRCAKAREVTA